MKGKTILILLFLAALVFLIVSYLNRKEGFQDNLYGQGKDSCKEICTEQHPEAARMDLDGDNDIADHVMGQCIQECQRAQGCTTCG